MSPLFQMYFLLIGILDTTQGIMIYIMQYIGNATKKKHSYFIMIWGRDNKLGALC